MSPDVAAAVVRLEQEGVLTPRQARLLGRVARGELVSVRSELRLLLYAGVLVTMAGVSLLVRQNLDRIGPVAVATGLGVGAALCLGWVARRAPPFSPGAVASPHLALDYLLLLGVLLTAADLAYGEAQFTPLGAGWPWHLLIVALFAGALAVRFDSRSVFSLALSTFAAWRGVSAWLNPLRWLSATPAAGLRLNAILCGFAFMAIALVLVRAGLKPHFAPLASHLGWLLVLGALLFGCGTGPGSELWYSLALLAAGLGLAAGALRSRQFTLFTMGVLAAYLALCVLFFRSKPDLVGGLFWFVITACLVLVGLLRARRTVQGEA